MATCWKTIISFAFAWILSCAGADMANAHASGGPIHYPGYPNSDFGPDWQGYFKVTKSLPNITFDIGSSFAGNIPIQRGNNLSLFFWAVEKEHGSLTVGVDDTTSPWQIWLNGGPGASSLFGFIFENGPIRLNADYSASANNYSINRLADTIWIDQPVGTGFSTLEPSGEGSVLDEDQVASDFFGFLENLVKVFPSLAKRPLYLLGESYAGTYIPYVMKYYFDLTNPPVNLAKIAIGDGTIGNGVVFEVVPLMTVLETFPQLIAYDIEVFKWFQEQNHLCGYDLNLTYPQNGKFQTLKFQPGAGTPRIFKRQESLLTQVWDRYQISKKRGAEIRREWKRDLSLRANGTIDPYYGCSLLREVLDYAVNYTYPWNEFPDGSSLDYYNIPSALGPPPFVDASVFLNDNATKTAIHAPDKVWLPAILYKFGGSSTGDDPSPEPMVFLDDLATNATERNVSIIIFSGNADSLVPHRGSEVVIQNTTFGGIQGFTRKPSTAWYDDDGTFAGIVHQERGWTYVLFHAAGHLVAMQKPAAFYTFVREFVLANNQTGLVVSSSNGSVSVVGGEDRLLAADVLTEDPDIYLGSVVTTSTYRYPTATISQWNSLIAEATGTGLILTSAQSGRFDVAGSGGKICGSILGLAVLSWLL